MILHTLHSDPKKALKYAKHIIKGRWPEGENVINSHPLLVVSYKQEFGKTD
jgi:hypothetical protein